MLVACSARVSSDEQRDDITAVSRFKAADITVTPAAFPQSVASGDPKPESVILWTRTVTSERLFLQVARDEDFRALLQLSDTYAELEVLPDARFDGCVKVRLDRLTPATTYYYRFIKEGQQGHGRTRTAPAANADVEVTFVVLSCQDFGGRYYHCLERAAQLQPDFVVHLGDYIYETTSDESFQVASPERSILFHDTEGALPLQVEREAGVTTVLAARSLSNYRQLYQEYRTDRSLQQLHEQAPMIIVWDDHEFANDAAQERAPSQAGLPDPQRRANADQAWFEYMPVDYPGQPDFEYDATAPFPDNLRIYRDFRFGRHLHLVMTDLRRYRPPHLIPEDEFPGTVLVDQPQLERLAETLPEFAHPYVNVEQYDDGSLARTLRDAASEHDWEFAPEKLAGNQDIAYLNALITRHNQSASEELPLVAEEQADGLGIAAIHIGKREPHTSFGARYFVVQEAFDALARSRYLESDGESENLLGSAQRDWFINALTESDATWKVWGNEYTFLRKLVDLRHVPVPDPTLAQRYLLSTEDWDGAPNERRALLGELAEVKNMAIVTGDIHSFFVGSPGVTSDADERPLASVTEFVCGAVSSATYEALLSGVSAVEGIAELAPLAGPILSASNLHVSYQNLESNGFAVVRVSAETLDVTFHQLAASKVYEPKLEGSLASHFTTEQFRLSAS